MPMKRKRTRSYGPRKKPSYRRYPRKRYSNPCYRNLRTGGFLGIEKKFVDQAKLASVLTAPTDASGGEHDPGTTNCLNAVAQGDGESQRDGKDYLIKSLHIRGHVKQDPIVNYTGGAEQLSAFVAVVWDKQTNAAQLNSEDVFKNITGSADGAAMPMRNLQYSSRFQVLWSKRFTWLPGELTYDGTNIEGNGTKKMFKLDLNNLNIKVLTKGTSANVTDIVDNSLHVIAYTDSSATPSVELEYASRIRFVG